MTLNVEIPIFHDNDYMSTKLVDSGLVFVPNAYIYIKLGEQYKLARIVDTDILKDINLEIANVLLITINSGNDTKISTISYTINANDIYFYVDVSYLNNLIIDYFVN